MRVPRGTRPRSARRERAPDATKHMDELEALHAATFACVQNVLPKFVPLKDGGGVSAGLSRAALEEALLPHCVSMALVAQPEDVLAGLATVPADDEPWALRRARDWLEKNPHELSKAKSAAARNIVRPLCQRSHRVSAARVTDALLAMGLLVEDPDSAVRLDADVTLDIVRVRLPATMTRDALAAFSLQVRSQCSLARIRQQCVGGTSALHIACLQVHSAAVRRVAQTVASRMQQTQSELAATANRAPGICSYPATSAIGSPSQSTTAQESRKRKRAEQSADAIRREASTMESSTASSNSNWPPCNEAEAKAAAGQGEAEAATAQREAVQEIEDEIARQLLQVQNGAPAERVRAAHHLAGSVHTLCAGPLGVGPLFNQLLSRLVSPTLDERPGEHELLLHVVERALCELGELVRPYAHKLCVVLEPLLIDDDHQTRVKGRELVTHLARAAGAATMVTVMRPDIAAPDVYVRNVTARGLAVVASALGVPLLLPFFRAVCRSKRAWQDRHTGIKIVQQLAILLGRSVRPHLRALVRMIEKGLMDEQSKVRSQTALALAALAQ